MKKGLLATVIAGLALSLSLVVYTIVALIPSNAGYTPATYNFNLAFRKGEVITEFAGYSEEAGNLTITVDTDEAEDPEAEGEETQTEDVVSPIVYNAETGEYTAENAGTATVVINEENGDTKTYTVTIYNHDATGTDPEVPYVICNEAHLREFAQIANGKVTNDELSQAQALAMDIALVNDVDLAGENWAPIGNAANPFTGTMEGNGYTISNMRIDVNTENFNEFLCIPKSPNYDIDLGFFGKTVGAKLTNINFDKAYITVSTDLLNVFNTRLEANSYPGVSGGWVTRLSVGTVAGYMTRTTYTSTIAEQDVKVTNTVISGFSFNGADNGIYPSGIGSVVGVMSESQLSNIDITSRIYADSKIAEGSRVGGVVAYVQAFDSYANITETAPEFISKIENVDVTTEVSTRYYLGDEAVAAANSASDKYNTIGLVAAHANNILIENVNVKNSRIIDNNGTIQNVGTTELDAQYLAVMSGGIAFANTVTHDVYDGADDEFTTRVFTLDVQNVYVNVAGNFGGIVAYAGANTTFTNCYSNVQAYAANVGGFAYDVAEGANILYMSNFTKENVVDATLGGITTAGFAVYMRGNFQGTERGATETTNYMRTTIKSTITGFGSYLENTSEADEVVAAGFAAYMYGTVAGYEVIATDFVVDTTISKSVNIVGLVSILGNTVLEGEDVLSTAKLDNIDVKMNAKSYHNKKLAQSTTKFVAGAAGQVFDGSTINAVNVDITLNDGATESEKYGAAIFGGLVGQVLAEKDEAVNVVITGNAVQGKVVIVEGNYWNKKLPTSEKTYYIQIAGGLIGLISGSDYNDALVSGLVITGNTVADLSLDVLGDHVYDGVEDNIDDIFFRIRGIGALVGNINNTRPDTDATNVLDLSSNTLSNVNVTANEEAFKFERIVDDIKHTFFLLGINKTAAVGSTIDYVYQYPVARITLPEYSEGAWSYNAETAAV